MTELVWPDAPTCHGESPRFAQTAASWREPRKRRDDSDPYEQTWRTCWYCGSIHPEDLYRLLDGQAVVEYQDFDANAFSGDHVQYTQALADHYSRRSEQGIHVGGSDWKYGWPHKFYIDGIPNPAVGQEYVIYTYGGERADESVEYTNHHGEKGWRRVHSRNTCPSTTRAKWYNEHLTDLAPETFEVMAALLETHSRIKFYLVDGKLHYSAPFRGFQH